MLQNYEKKRLSPNFIRKIWKYHKSFVYLQHPKTSINNEKTTHFHGCGDGIVGSHSNQHHGKL
jgi:hypothetical protein